MTTGRITKAKDIVGAIIYPPLISLALLVAKIYREGSNEIGLLDFTGMILIFWLSYLAIESLAGATKQNTFLILFCMMVPIIGWIAIVAMTIYQYIQQPKNPDVS